MRVSRGVGTARWANTAVETVGERELVKGKKGFGHDARGLSGLYRDIGG
jgi:hypothetical protein